MGFRKRIDKASGVILNNIVVVTFISSLINTVLLCISTVKERWMFGDIPCQLHAMICYVLLSSIAWLTTLAAIERLYKCVSSGSYSMTFSDINTKILIFGMYMTAFFLCTGPMYGWGEYSQFKGLIMIKVGLLSHKTAEPSFLCNTTIPGGDFQNIQYLSQIISVNLQEKTSIFIRTANNNCKTGDIFFTVRIQDVTSLTLFLEEVEKQTSGTVLYDLITHFGDNITERYSPHITVESSDMENYKNVLLPFQSLGICSLDFSAVNKYKRSATYYIFGTSLVLPFVITAICGLIVLVHHYSGSLPDHIVYFKIIYYGSMLQFIACFPYYVVNFLNGSGHFIAKHINFLSTFCFYNSSLFLVIPYLLYRKPRCRLWARPKQSFTTTTNGGIQEEIQVDNEISKVDYV